MENNVKKKGYKSFGAVLLFITPALIYINFEFITGSLTQIRGIYLLLNLCFYYLVYLTVFALTNSMRGSYLVLNTFFTIWGLAEYYVVQFRARPIMLWDVLAVKTAATVSGNYSYEVTPHIAAAVVFMIVLDVLVVKFPFRLKKGKVHGAAAGISCLVSAVFFVLFFKVMVNAFSLDVSMWNPEESYENYGTMLCTMRMFGYLDNKPPQGYSQAEVARIQAEIEGMKEQELPWKSSTGTVPANIICIMNESFSELNVIAPFETDEPYLAFYNSIEENCVKGQLYMPVFGSMTSNSEYEFLTGNSMAFAPSGSVPYQIYMRNPTYSLPLILKEQGYRTVAMHPYPADNWNRTEAYARMGFDEFLDEDYYEDSPLIRNYVSDKGDYDKIIELTETKEEGQPLFIFNVTMQNHGGYEEEFESTVHLTEYEDMPMTEQYLSLMKESDQALSYLLDYYSRIEEPTMIVLFGDHQPSVEPEFYDALYGQSIDTLKPEDYLRRYITPFFVWTNYETESMMSVKMSAQYLSNVILQRANLEMTDYLYFLNSMQKAAPVVHMLGYYNDEMQWESWTNWREKKEYDMFHQFEMLQYNNMFEKKRTESLFK